LLGGAALVAVYRAQQGVRLAPRDRCPACGAPIMVTRFKRARQAFTCARCGEVAVWL
jgi:predicted RNA-binding Zn-ribbon protein involved in translation (DUF1610 family)